MASGQRVKLVQTLRRGARTHDVELVADNAATIEPTHGRAGLSVLRLAVGGQRPSDNDTLSVPSVPGVHGNCKYWEKTLPRLSTGESAS